IPLMLPSVIDTLSLHAALPIYIIWSASATVDQLAAKAGVSIATISRFARTVGCDDTRDLKMKLAQASTVGSRFLDPSAPAEESRSEEHTSELQSRESIVCRLLL